MGATALTPLMAIVVQVGTVPLLLQAWGAAKYGDWLMLFAVPSYLALANLGFGDASGSDMTMRVAAGDREGALETFQSSWALLVLMSVILLSLSALAVYWVPWQRWLHLASLSNRQAATVILVLAAYVTISQQCGVIESGYRCVGLFATGIFLIAIIRLTEAVLGSVVGLMTGSLLYSALTYLLVRIVGTFIYTFLLRRKRPWVRLGFTHAKVKTVKRLCAPALGFLALPLGYAMSLQGMTIVIGAVLGPLAVAVFSTLRVITRLNSQLVNAIVYAVWPEISSAFGAGRIGLAQRLFCRTFQIGIATSTATVIFLCVLGPFIYRIWVRDAISLHVSCFYLLLLVSFGDSLWFMSGVVPMATNSHHRLALAFLSGSLLSLLIARFLLPRLGVDGGAWAQLVFDVGIVWLALRTSLRELKYTWLEFITEVLTPSSFRQSWRSVLDSISSLARV